MRKSKNIIAIVFFMLFTSLLHAAPAVAVIDFEPGASVTQQQAVIMTGLFRSELVRSGQVNVVDRGSLDRIIVEYKFQYSDWVNPDSVKGLGTMVGADYLITGNFGVVGNQLILVVEMTDIQTGRIHHSSRLALASTNEYDRKVAGFAREFAEKFPRENPFTGEWEGFVDDYEFNILFLYSNMCIITITVMQNGREIREETNGTWSYDDNVIRVSGNFANSKISNLRRVNWTSVYTFSNNDNSAFNMLLTLPGDTIQKRISFIRTFN